MDLAAPPSARGAPPPPFSPLWLRRLERLVAGTAVALGGGTHRVFLRCRRGVGDRSWMVEVRNGRIRRVRHVTAPPPHATVLGHSLTVGWRLFGLTVRGFHRVDELVIEQSVDGGVWTRHPLPPLDEALVDLSTPPATSVRWHERVVGSPLGTLFVQRVVADGRLRLVDASGLPAPAAVDVISEVAWDDLMAARGRARCYSAPPPRSWRGTSAEVPRVRSAVEVALAELPPPTEQSVQRDLELMAAIRVFRAMTGVLRGSSEWRELWRPSVGRTR